MFFNELRHEEEKKADLRRKQQPGAANDCPRIRQSVTMDFAVARALSPGPDIKSLLDAVRQQLSRSALTRVQIKRCAPGQEVLLRKLEKCVATRDTECRFSKQEADEFNAQN